MYSAGWETMILESVWLRFLICFRCFYPPSIDLHSRTLREHRMERYFWSFGLLQYIYTMPTAINQHAMLSHYVLNTEIKERYYTAEQNEKTVTFSFAKDKRIGYAASSSI